ncbi:MAG TPA: hypothetical protein VD859_10425 [Nocardioides sp.]|nr:hypothetical protein [Nocardioides sp.]
MSEHQPPPPPPPGGTGGPPPPPAGGYGAQPPVSGGGQWDLGATVSYGWNKFQQNMAQIIIAALAVVVGIIAIAVVGFIIVGAITSSGECEFDQFGNLECDDGTPFIVSMILFLLVYFLIFLFGQIVGAGLIRGALAITEGRPFQASEVFKFDKIGPVVVTSLIVGAATFVGLILCYLPGLVIMFATSYSLYFVIDKGLAPMDAIKASVNLVKENLSSTLIWYIVGGLIASVGAIVCGIGLLVTLPIMLIGTAYTYKTLTGQPVAP